MFFVTGRWDFRGFWQSANTGDGTADPGNLRNSCNFRFFMGCDLGRFLSGHHRLIRNRLTLLDRLWQAECRLERSYARAQRELERLQASRRQTVQTPEEQPADTSSAAADPPALQPRPAQNAPNVVAFPAVALTSEIRNPTSEIRDRLSCA